MPVLRMPTDTTLGDTLGNLGRSLTEGFNPLNQLRAYDIQQQMWLRQQQLLQMQRENAARQAAIEQWGHIVPADKLPQIALMIYQGAPYDQIARSAAQLSGNLIDDPNAMQKNIRYIEQITGKPYDYATLGPPVAGPNTAKQADDWKVSQSGKTAASTALGTATGEQVSRAPLAGMIDEDTPAAALHNQQIYQTVYGKPPENGLVDAGPITAAANRARMAVQQGLIEQAKATGGYQARQALVGLYKDDPAADAQNRAVYSVLNNGAQFEAGMPVPVGPNTNAAYNKALGGRQETQAEAEARGKVLGGGAPSGTTIPTSLPPSGNPNVPSAPAAPAAAPPAAAAPAAAPPAAAPPAAAPPAAAAPNANSPAPAPATPPAAAVSVPNPSAPFAPPAPVVRQTPAGTIIGQTPTETAASTSVTDANLKDLTQALTEAQSAKQLLPKLNQLHDLVHLYNAAGPTGQLDAATVKAFSDKWGVSVGDKGAAYQAIQQLLNSEIPDIRQKAGIQRLAGPAIKEEQLIIGNPNMPPKVMDNIIANEKAAADIQVERGNIAFKARYGQGPDALAMPDYAQQSFDLDNTIQQRTDDYRKQYGAVGTESEQPATITTPPPMLSGNPFMDAIGAVSRMFGGGGGGSQTPPPQTPPPDAAPPPQQFQFDPKTNSIVPVQ